MKPHRGSSILVLGILSLVTCAPLGIPAWLMGNNDLREMNLGLMDPSGRDSTGAGRVCGMIGTAIFILSIVVVLVVLLMGGIGAVAASKATSRQHTEMTP